MGGSDSRCCTDSAEDRHTPVGIKNSVEEFGPVESPFKATRFLHDDPRSPLQTIDRTPIEVMSTPMQPKPLMRVQPVVKNSVRNRHSGTVNNAVNSDTVLLDSLPPDSGTPVTTKFFSKQDQDDGMFTVSTVCDPRSPSQGIVRTPLLLEESEVFSDIEAVTDGKALIICETPKKHQEDLKRGAAISKFSPDVNFVDPRSPTQGIERTPVAKSEQPDRHTAAVVGVPNHHDPRSPITEVSRTPIGALFSGHRELRRTVLLTNALMASPLSKKPAQNMTSKEEKGNLVEKEFSESLEDNTNDEIPAILRCNIDFNNSCSSSMIASIGSEVDCISLDNSLEEDQLSVDTLEIEFMERKLRAGDCTDYCQKDEKTTAEQPQDTVSPCDPQPETTEITLKDESSKIAVLPDLLPFAATIDKREQNENLDVCRNLEGNQSLHHNEHADDVFSNNTQSPAAAESDTLEVTKLPNLQQTCSHIPANSSDEPIVEMCSNISPDDATHSDMEIAKVDSSRNELVKEIKKSDEFQYVTNQEEIKRPGSEELQIAENLGDFDGITISTRGSQNAKCDVNACLDVGTEVKSLPDNHGDLDNEDVFTHSLEFKEDPIWEKGGIQQEETYSTAVLAAGTENIRDLGYGVTEMILAKTTALNNLDELQSLPVYKPEELTAIKMSDECNDLGAKMGNEVIRKERKPRRKLRPPTTVIHRRKNTDSTGYVQSLKDSPIGHVSKSQNERRGSFARRPKSDSDDARSLRALDQINSSRSVFEKPTRKSASKLVTPTAVRSPLAVLTNDAKGRPDGAFQFTGSPAKTTKLPRYQGTPPIAVDTRSLSISFSGRRRSSSSHSVERQKIRQKSFTYNKEN